MIARSIARGLIHAFPAALLCLVAVSPALADNPPAEKPLILLVAPIAPEAKDGERLSTLDDGYDDLKAALWNAWQRITDRQLDMSLRDDDMGLAVEQNSKLLKPVSPKAADYIIRTRYSKIGSRVRATAELQRPKEYHGKDEVRDDSVDLDGPTPFRVLGEKLAIALAKAENINVTTYRLAFCRFALVGQTSAGDALVQILRETTVMYFGRATPVPILADEPPECSQQNAGSEVLSAVGTNTIYVRGKVYFFPDHIMISLIVAGEVVAQTDCAQERELQKKETIYSLIPDFWSRLNEQIRRHRSGG